MANCTSCGQRLDADARFCGVCGQPVQAQPAPQPRPLDPPQPDPQPYLPPAQPQAYPPAQPQAYPPAQPQAYPPAQPQAYVPPAQPQAYVPPAQPHVPPAQPHVPPAQPHVPPAQQPEPHEVVPPRSPNGALLEVAKRIVSLVLITVGGMLTFFVPEKVYVVEPLDWSAEYATQDNTGTPIAQFVSDKLDRNFKTKTDDSWAALRAEVMKEPERLGKRRKVFSYNDPLLEDNTGIMLIQRGQERAYLRVSQPDLDYLHDGLEIPLSKARPYLFHGIPMLVLAALAYVLIGWRRKKTPVHYKLWVTTLLDLMGLGFALLISVLVARVLEESVGDAVMAGAIASMVPLAFLLPSAYYASKRVVFVSNGVRVLSLFGQTDFPFSRIATTYTAREAQAPILGIILIVLSITNGASLLIGLALLLRKDLRFTMRRDDGKTFKIWVKSADGVEEMTQALVANRVPHESM